MDLSDFKPKRDTVEVQLKDPNGEPLINKDGSPMTWTRYLPHTKVYKEVRYDQADFLMGKGEEKITSREYAKLGMDMIVKTTESWDITLEGKKVKFSEEKAREVLDTYEFILPQLQKAESEVEVFT